MPDQGSRIRRTQVIAVCLLTGAGLVNYLDRSTLSIANTVIRGEMSLSPTQMGLLLSIFSLTYAFAQLPVGALLDRFGARLVLGAGVFFWSLAQLACGFVGSLSQFLVARAVLGVGEAPQFPATIKVVGEWFSVRDRGAPTGVVLSSSCLAPAIAPPVLTVLMLALGWRWMFVLTGLAGLAVAAAWSLLYRDRPAAEVAEVQTDEPATGAGPLSWRDWRALFGHATTWGMLLGNMGAIYMVWLYLTWLPSYLEHERHLSVAHTGWVVAIPYLAGTLGNLGAGRAADALMRAGVGVVASRKWLVCIGLVGAAATTAPGAYVPNLVLAVACISAAMFFINVATAASWIMVSAITPARQVASLGSLQNFGGYFAGSFAPLVTGYVVERTGSYVDALLVSAGVCVAAALAYFILVRKPVHAPLQQNA